MPRRNRRYSATAHVQPMADGKTQRATKRWGDDVPRETQASEVTIRRVAPKPRLSHEEIKERMFYGGVVRRAVEPKRAWR